MIFHPLKTNLFGVVAVTFEDELTAMGVHGEVDKVHLARTSDSHSKVGPNFSVFVDLNEDVVRWGTVDSGIFRVHYANIRRPQILLHVRIVDGDVMLADFHLTEIQSWIDPHFAEHHIDIEFRRQFVDRADVLDVKFDRRQYAIRVWKLVLRIAFQQSFEQLLFPHCAIVSARIVSGYADCRRRIQRQKDQAQIQELLLHF